MSSEVQPIKDLNGLSLQDLKTMVDNGRTKEIVKAIRENKECRDFLNKLRKILEHDSIDELAVAHSTAYQENKLLRCHRDGMTATETKLFYMGLSKIVPHLPAKKGQVYNTPNGYSGKIGFTFTPQEINDILGHRCTEAEIKTLGRGLQRKVIELEYSNGLFVCINLFHKIIWIPNDGLTMIFHDDLKPYILELQNGNYTKIAVENIYNLSSTYAMRLLELGAELTKIPHKSKRKRDIDLDLLRRYLDVPENTYKRMDVFKRTVINEPLKEVNKLDLPFKITCTPYKDKEDKRRVAGFTLELKYPSEKKALPKTKKDSRDKPKAQYKSYDAVMPEPHKQTDEDIISNILRLMRSQKGAFTRSALEKYKLEHPDLYARAEEISKDAEK